MVGFYERVQGLTLWTQQRAWLAAVPSDNDDRSRSQRIEADGGEVLFPPNPAPYLTDWLFEIGPASGEGAISWRDMTAWQEISGVTLEPWEAKALRKLSVAWVNERHRATALNAEAPYSINPEKEVEDRVTAQFAAMKAAFAGLADSGNTAG